MSRCSIPKPTWETLTTDPLGWTLRYVDDTTILGEPAYFKGEVPADDYDDANHLKWDDPRIDSILVRSQGQNPIEVRIGDGPWTPIAELDTNAPAEKPVFPADSIWSAWND